MKVSYKKLWLMCAERDMMDFVKDAEYTLPKEYSGKLAAIAVAGLFGAVKEQYAGLYAEELASGAKPKVSVTLENENGEQRYRSVEDNWLVANGLDVGSVWPQEE